MWQRQNRNSTVFHYLALNNWRDVKDGEDVETVCGMKLESSRVQQDIIPIRGRCGICNGVFHLVSTSIDDAKVSLRNEENIDVLRCAVRFVRPTQTSLKKAIESKIRRLEKEEVM